MDSLAESDGDVAKRSRAEEIDGDLEVLKKKMRVENGEDELRRVAEIVLVLSAMARMRGGRDPTGAEKAMMAEAREKVVALCEELAPKDILPRESFGVLIDDLGLNRLKEQRLGFRTPKLSIADKLALATRRMEESKTFVAQPASYQAQRLQNNGVPGESRALPPNVHVFSFDKPGHVPVSTGSFQHTPAAQVFSPASIAPAFPPPHIEAPAASVSGTIPNNIARDSSQVLQPRVDRAHLRSDGRLNGPPFVPHVPVNSSPDQCAVRTVPVTLQPQSGSWVSIGMQKKAPDHLSGKVDGNANVSAPHMTTHTSAGQTTKPAVSHAALGTKHTMHQHHPMQGMHFAHASPVFNNHLEISKLVQKVLEPKLAERPTWTPPSRDYMIRAISCQFCKVVINGMENVLVCDACEKGFHVGCLQSYNAKAMPRGEWHCPRCLAMNRGKPFPPKYGRVTRNMNASKVSSNSAGNMFSDQKPETMDEKVKHPNAMNNGKADVTTQPQAVKVTESSSESNLQHVNETNENDKCADTKKNDVPKLVKSPCQTKGIVVEASPPTSTGSSSDKRCQPEVKSEVSPSDDSLISESESKIPFVSKAMNTSNTLQTSSNQNNVDPGRMSNGAEVPVYQHCDYNGVVECNKHCYSDGQGKDGGKENVEKDRVHDQYRELSGVLDSGPSNLNWLSDITRVVGEKKFFQSCSINGVAYKVQDYALFRSSNDKLTPLKIQEMWEDCRNSLKWLTVHKCYFPDDLPKEVGRPGAPQSNEVYESTHDSDVSVAVVQGPCEVLPFRKFGQENDSIQVPQTSDRTAPIFIRNWFYDESKRAFCPSAS